GRGQKGRWAAPPPGGLELPGESSCLLSVPSVSSVVPSLPRCAVQNPYLIGPNVYLRPLEVEDAPTLAGWFNDPEVTRFLLARRPITRAWEEDYLRRMADSATDLVLGVVVREGEK